MPPSPSPEEHDETSHEPGASDPARHQEDVLIRLADIVIDFYLEWKGRQEP